jgi:hypothetical protein
VNWLRRIADRGRRCAGCRQDLIRLQQTNVENEGMDASETKEPTSSRKPKLPRGRCAGGSIWSRRADPANLADVTLRAFETLAEAARPCWPAKTRGHPRPLRHPAKTFRLSRTQCSRSRARS